MLRMQPESPIVIYVLWEGKFKIQPLKLMADPKWTVLQLVIDVLRRCRDRDMEQVSAEDLNVIEKESGALIDNDDLLSSGIIPSGTHIKLERKVGHASESIISQQQQQQQRGLSADPTQKNVQTSLTKSQTQTTHQNTQQQPHLQQQQQQGFLFLARAEQPRETTPPNDQQTQKPLSQLSQQSQYSQSNNNNFQQQIQANTYAPSQISHQGHTNQAESQIPLAVADVRITNQEQHQQQQILSEHPFPSQNASLQNEHLNLPTFNQRQPPLFLNSQAKQQLIEEFNKALENKFNITDEMRFIFSSPTYANKIISAAAGSGKPTLQYLVIVALMRQQNCKAEDFLIITLNARAKEKMIQWRDKLSQNFNELKNVAVTTLDQLLKDLYLREEVKKLYFKEKRPDVNSNDLLNRFCKHAMTPEVTSYLSQYQQVFFPEAEDLSDYHFNLLVSLSQMGKTLTFVGDPEQSCSEFSGVFDENFQAELKKSFLQETRLFRVKTNQRQQHSHIKFANLILWNSYIEGEYLPQTMVPIKREQQGRKPILVVSEKERLCGLEKIKISQTDALLFKHINSNHNAYMCENTVQLVHRLVHEEHVPQDEIAVVVMAKNSSQKIQNAFLQYNRLLLEMGKQERCIQIHSLLNSRFQQLNMTYEKQGKVLIAIPDQVKNLEFDYIILYDVSEQNYCAGQQPQQQQQASIQKARNIYMASTRARKQIYLTFNEFRLLKDKNNEWHDKIPNKICQPVKEIIQKGGFLEVEFNQPGQNNQQETRINDLIQEVKKQEIVELLKNKHENDIDWGIRQKLKRFIVTDGFNFLIQQQNYIYIREIKLHQYIMPTEVFEIDTEIPIIQEIVQDNELNYQSRFINFYIKKEVKRSHSEDLTVQGKLFSPAIISKAKNANSQDNQDKKIASVYEHLIQQLQAQKQHAEHEQQQEQGLELEVEEQDSSQSEDSEMEQEERGLFQMSEQLNNILNSPQRLREIRNQIIYSKQQAQFNNSPGFGFKLNWYDQCQYEIDDLENAYDEYCDSNQPTTAKQVYRTMLQEILAEDYDNLKQAIFPQEDVYERVLEPSVRICSEKFIEFIKQYAEKNKCKEVYINDYIAPPGGKAFLKYMNITMYGIVDIRIGEKAIFEIKCGKNRNSEWLLQLLLYASLYKIYKNINIQDVFIYNLKEKTIYQYDITYFTRHHELVWFCEAKKEKQHIQGLKSYLEEKIKLQPR